jgi:surfeit locus 1 family protein
VAARPDFPAPSDAGSVTGDDVDRMSGRPRFRPGLGLTLGAVILVAIGLAAGKWQMGRAEEKRVLGEQIDRAAREPPIRVPGTALPLQAVEHRTVEARGVFVPAHAILLENRLRHGLPGFEVLMPLRIEGSDMHVLVNRGWIAAPRDRSRIPEVRNPDGPVIVSGRVIQREARILDLGAEGSTGAVRANLTVDAFRDWSGLQVQPFIVRQQNDLRDGLAREWPRPDAGVEKHLGYAWQWFGLAAVAGVFYGILGFRRGRER